MVFSSIVFLLYFLPLLLFVYYLSDRKYRNIVLLLFSVLFYAWGAPRFIFVILGTTVLDFFLVKTIAAATTKRRKLIMLIISLAMNVGLLFYFKYYNFFIDNFNQMTAMFGMSPVKIAKIVMPIGISFYTFESITYVVDVYRGVHKPLRNFWDYQTYIIFFPKLIAGPIVRYHDIADQINGRFDKDHIDNKLLGFYRFIIGLAKKVLIANVVGAQATILLETNSEGLTSYMAWIGALAYTMQIYFDFSGYSDMAIGLSRMFGFQLPENFDKPYISGSITEFWRRWHITLGTWMRNYLYIPLGGNKVSTGRLYFNLWIVFLISGFWHGASWSFILWGAYHGLFLVLERAFLGKYLAMLPKLLSAGITFFIVLIGWVFFSIEDVTDGFDYIGRMFSFEGGLGLHVTNHRFYWMLALGIVLSFCSLHKGIERLGNVWYARETLPVQRHYLMMFLHLLILTVCIADISGYSFNPFIYFRF